MSALIFFRWMREKDEKKRNKKKKEKKEKRKKIEKRILTSPLTHTHTHKQPQTTTNIHKHQDWTFLDAPSGRPKDISARPRNRKGEEGEKGEEKEIEKEREKEKEGKRKGRVGWEGEDLEGGEAEGEGEGEEKGGLSGGGVAFVLQIILVYFITFQRKRTRGLWMDGL